ncbi:unnamed protein product [Periconia digitata]|uniref:Metallo-dependent hydrolase n=1 Tax=Periconia digitata TaxID=1303443 RepID=A0A9W4XD28_9PLEO|nr:unnamed protein product [Periconia digitata]
MEKPESFPWDMGVFDAHCHPTDTMSSIASIPSMRARCLTVMATRHQDQTLVAQTAKTHGVKSADPNSWAKEECVVPCFGWHPWFAHMMYIDDEDNDDNEGIENTSPQSAEHDLDGSTKQHSSTTTSNSNDERLNKASPEPLEGAQKLAHYTSILHPTLTPQNSSSSLLSLLPSPYSFSSYLSQTRQHLLAHPYALVGEIGLDRSYRIPEPWPSNSIANDGSRGAREEKEGEESLTPGGREGRRLTPFRCSPAHQKRIFRKQLQLAAELGRGVSVHGVQAHGLVYEVLSSLWEGREKVVLSKREARRREKQQALDRNDHNDEEEEEEERSKGDEEEEGGKGADVPYPPRICLHSYSAPLPHLKSTYFSPTIPADIFLSFSSAINLSSVPFEPSTSPSYAGNMEDTPQAFITMIRAIPSHMLLVESDLHTAGAEMDQRLEDIVRRVCWCKGWGLREGVEVLRGNWGRFVFGDEWERRGTRED